MLLCFLLLAICSGWIAGQRDVNSPLSDITSLPVIVSWDKMGHADGPLTCGHLKCYVTTDSAVTRRRDPMAIMFYGTDFGYRGFPLPRQSNHIWALLHEESPKNNDWLFTAESALALFNLTSTFSRKSHYPIPTMWLQDEHDITDMTYVVSLEEKNRLRRKGLSPVVFVHMDCSTPADRSYYMRLLKQYIPVDSYGTCEHNKDFPSSGLTFDDGMGPMTSPDFYKLIAQYKFAFAIENTVCDDYITEKFWRPLKLGVVPLVFGSPKIREMGPANKSFIDIRDFESVKHLAEHISFLDTHDKEYLKYQAFKQTGVTNPILKDQLERRDWGSGKTIESYFHGFECFTCRKLHEVVNKVKNNQPLPVWSVDGNLACPEPKLFDKLGQYTLDSSYWAEKYHYSQYYLKSIKCHINNGINASLEHIHRFAEVSQKSALG